ncbi:MAG: isoprenylcysteine carboxylmethyltransferase family protein [Chloroflexota bacterium]
MESLILMASLFLWSIIHSVMASLWIKDFIRRRLGERVFRYYRMFYNIFAGLSLLPIVGLMFILGDHQLYSILKPWVVFFLFVQFLSLMALMVGLKQTGALEFLGLNAFIGKDETGSQKFSTRGLYGIVRHPLYSAGLVFLWFSPVMTRNSLLVSICLSIYLFVGALIEERKLIIEYGDIYREYRKMVPMMIPGIKWNK